MHPRRKVQEKVKQTILYLQKFMDTWWYSPSIGLLALADNFILIVPTDGILISSAILKPKRWIFLALCVAVGSTAGALVLAHLVGVHGWPWILDMFPGVHESRMWTVTEDFFQRYGLAVVFFVAVTPLVQQPAVILAALAHTPLMQLLVIIFSGRMLKYIVMSYLATHAPRLLGRLWGVQGELKEVGIQLGGSIRQPRTGQDPPPEG